TRAAQIVRASRWRSPRRDDPSGADDLSPRGDRDPSPLPHRAGERRPPALRQPTLRPPLRARAVDREEDGGSGVSLGTRAPVADPQSETEGIARWVKSSS